MPDSLPQGFEQALREARVGRLATVDEQGQPYLVPFCFVWLAGGIYFALDAKPKRVPVERLKRVRNLIERPNVGLVVDHWSEDWTELWYVQVRGRAELIRDGEERGIALNELKTKYPQYRNMPAIDENPVVKIVPIGVTTWSASGESATPSSEY